MKIKSLMSIATIFIAISAHAKDETAKNAPVRAPANAFVAPANTYVKDMGPVTNGEVLRVWDDEAKVLCYVISGSNLDYQHNGTPMASGGGIFCMPRKSLTNN